MDIIIYPDPKKNLNVNEKQFITIELFKDTIFKNYKFYKDTEMPFLNDINVPIRTITILLDNYGTFIERNIEFIINKKNINFFIHENDIHKITNKSYTYERYMLLRSELENNKHIYILAYYWYHYTKLYNINNDNVLIFPRFVHETNLQKFNDNPINKIFVTDYSSISNPITKYLLSLDNKNIEILEELNNNNEEYFNKYLCCLTLSSDINTPYIKNIFFEILASGSLLLAYNEHILDPMRQIGFIDGINYLSCNRSNLLDRINFICHQRNTKIIDTIRLNGLKMVTENHTDRHRYISLDKNISNPQYNIVNTHAKNIIGNIPIYYINLDRSEDRKKRIEKLFHDNHITNYKRIEAIDGKKLNMADYENKFVFTKKNISIYEIACTLSHLKAIRQAYNDNCENALIMEDDCNFDYIKFKNLTLENLITTNNQWECIQVACTISPKIAKSLFKSDDILINYHCYGAVAYLINRKGMEKIVNYNSNDITVSEDYIFGKLNTFITKPYFSYYYYKEEKSFIRENVKANFTTQTLNKDYWDDYYGLKS